MKVFELAIFSYILKQYNTMFKPLLSRYDITQVEIDILAFLYNNPEYKYASDIVKIRCINKGQASIAIDKLVEKGLLQRQADPQCRRCNLLLLTEASHELIAQIKAVQTQFKKKIYHEIADSDKEKFDQILKQMYLNLGGYNNE